VYWLNFGQQDVNHYHTHLIFSTALWVYLVPEIKPIHKQNGKNNLLCICVGFRNELFLNVPLKTLL